MFDKAKLKTVYHVNKLREFLYKVSRRASLHPVKISFNLFTIFSHKVYETNVSGAVPRVSDLAHCARERAGASHGIITYLRNVSCRLNLALLKFEANFTEAVLLI